MNIEKNVKGNEEQIWDLKAHQFNKNQNRIEQLLPQNICDYLKREYPGSKSLMDVGGGSGRYALLFAEKFDEIVMTDISANMLSYAKENAEDNNIKNIQFYKFDWNEDQASPLHERKFDVVFSSMCPATRHMKGLKKMMEFSCGVCVLNQFILSKDSFMDFVETKLEDRGFKRKREKNPHMDRSLIQEAFNDLWNLGYTPEIKIFSELSEKQMSVEEAMEYYLNHRRMASVDKDIQVEWIQAYFTEKNTTISQYNESALLVWSVMQK